MRDWRVRDLMSKFGSPRSRKVSIQDLDIGKGEPVQFVGLVQVVPARWKGPDSWASGFRPGQRRSLLGVRAPVQAARATVAAASVMVMVVLRSGQGVVVPTKVCGLKLQSSGEEIILSSTPSCGSQWAMAAAVMVSNSQW